MALRTTLIAVLCTCATVCYARDYAPDTGRYVQSDPIGLRGGLNSYRYAVSSPLRFIDPRGLNPGDLFQTPDDAAIDAAIYARRFWNKDIEYGGWIHPVDQCWTYDFIVGGARSIPRTTLMDMRPDNATAIWHTHPDTGNPPYDNSFSGARGDTGLANNLGIPIYLNTPSGDNKVYDPNSGQEAVISSPMRPRTPTPCDQCKK